VRIAGIGAIVTQDKVLVWAQNPGPCVWDALTQVRLIQSVTVDPDCAITNFYLFPGQADNPLNVVFPISDGGEEYHNIPSLRLTEKITDFTHDQVLPIVKGRLHTGAPYVEAAGDRVNEQINDQCQEKAFDYLAKKNEPVNASRVFRRSPASPERRAMVPTLPPEFNCHGYCNLIIT
jgi:hypothetical protein